MCCKSVCGILFTASFQQATTHEMLIGYARVSTEDQNLDLQRDAFTAGCERIFEEKASPAMIDRGSPKPCRICGEEIAL